MPCLLMKCLNKLIDLQRGIDLWCSTFSTDYTIGASFFVALTVDSSVRGSEASLDSAAWSLASGLE